MGLHSSGDARSFRALQKEWRGAKTREATRRRELNEAEARARREAVELRRAVRAQSKLAKLARRARGAEARGETCGLLTLARQARHDAGRELHRVGRLLAGLRTANRPRRCRDRGDPGEAGGPAYRTGRRGSCLPKRGGETEEMLPGSEFSSVWQRGAGFFVRTEKSAALCRGRGLAWLEELAPVTPVGAVRDKYPAKLVRLAFTGRYIRWVARQPPPSDAQARSEVPLPPPDQAGMEAQAAPRHGAEVVPDEAGVSVHSGPPRIGTSGRNSRGVSGSRAPPRNGAGAQGRVRGGPAPASVPGQAPGADTEREGGRAPPARENQQDVDPQAQRRRPTQTNAAELLLLLKLSHVT